MNILNVFSSLKTTQRPQTTENEKVDWLWVVIFIGIIVPIVCFSSFMLYLYRKKRSEFFLIHVHNDRLLCYLELIKAFKK